MCRTDRFGPRGVIRLPLAQGKTSGVQSGCTRGRTKAVTDTVDVSQRIYRRQQTDIRDRERSEERGRGADKINLFEVTVPPGKRG